MEALFVDDAYAKSCEATITEIDGNAITLDRTVFYPSGGGQPGDTGLFKTADGREVGIVDTQKGDTPGSSIHIVADNNPTLIVGDKVTAELDWERRHRLMRMHTCLHVLSAVLPYPVTGGQINDGKGRLDFDLPEATLDKDELTAELNRLIETDQPLTSEWITDEELAARPELVKTMSVQPPTGAGRVRLVRIADLDLQPCGGTHVARIGEIGRVEITKIKKKGRQNRRVSVAFA